MGIRKFFGGSYNPPSSNKPHTYPKTAIEKHYEAAGLPVAVSVTSVLAQTEKTAILIHEARAKLTELNTDKAYVLTAIEASTDLANAHFELSRHANAALNDMNNTTAARNYYGAKAQLEKICGNIDILFDQCVLDRINRHGPSARL